MINFKNEVTVFFGIVDEHDKSFITHASDAITLPFNRIKELLRLPYMSLTNHPCDYDRYLETNIESHESNVIAYGALYGKVDDGQIFHHVSDESDALTLMDFLSNANLFIDNRETEKETTKCQHCQSKNINHLEATTYECYDCGKTFEGINEHPLRFYVNTDTVDIEREQIGVSSGGKAREFSIGVRHHGTKASVKKATEIATVLADAANRAFSDTTTKDDGSVTLTANELNDLPNEIQYGIINKNLRKYDYQDFFKNHPYLSCYEETDTTPSFWIRLPEAFGYVERVNNKGIKVVDLMPDLEWNEVNQILADAFKVIKFKNIEFHHDACDERNWLDQFYPQFDFTRFDECVADIFDDIKTIEKLISQYEIAPPKKLSLKKRG